MTDCADRLIFVWVTECADAIMERNNLKFERMIDYDD